MNQELINNYPSFGRYPKQKPSSVEIFSWQNQKIISDNILPRGYGRSYGDSCLNEDGSLVDTTQLDHLISFDEKTGILKAEAGIQFKNIIEFIVPKGWFLPITPGTKLVSLAGAIANDVHGKNHHAMGSFGNHVLEFELLRSDGEKLICSEKENQEMFYATIGGLGLTGTILWATFKCIKFPTPYLYTESIKFKNLDEFFEINEASEKDFPYTVAWIDCAASGNSLGRGLYNRGRHADQSEVKSLDWTKEISKLEKGAKPFPFDYPFINSFTVKAFNKAFYNKQVSKTVKTIAHFEPFFYPLDGFDGWNKAYGKYGFLQYQLAVPFENGKETIRKVLEDIQRSGLYSFLVVLKTFGNIPSKGMLSFPMPGYTLALDFRMDGEKTLKLLDELDVYVREVGGRLYPAKDARMSSQDFPKFYPKLEEFKKYVDPNHSSSFWRRVVG